MGYALTEKYLLTVSHSGLGVGLTGGWELVARDFEIVYLESGRSSELLRFKALKLETLKEILRADGFDWNRRLANSI